MSEKQKSYAKWAVILAAIFGGGIGADAAGVDLSGLPDLNTLEKLGVVSGAVIVYYLHNFIRPIGAAILDQLRANGAMLTKLVERDEADRAAIRDVAGALDTKPADAEPRATTAAAPTGALKVIKGAAT